MEENMAKPPRSDDLKQSDRFRPILSVSAAGANVGCGSKRDGGDDWRVGGLIVEM